MSSSPADWSLEPAIDHRDLCQKVRFSLDDPPRASSEELQKRTARLREAREFCRASMLRVRPSIMPSLHRTVSEACARLLLSAEPEVFIKADAELNAKALPPLDGAPPAIVLHSSLVDLLSSDELATVIGHELGHVALEHAGGMRENRSPADEMFQEENSRAAEISADRIGMLAAPSVEAALLAELKIASGLRSEHLRLDIASILENFSQRSDEFDRDWERMTHPELTMRFWAEVQFSQTDLYLRLRGQSGGRPFLEVEREIEERFLALGSGIAFRAAADVMHEALAWIGVLIVSEDAQVTDQERDALVRHVGLLWAEDACTYARRNGRKAVERRAKETVANLATTGERTRRRLTAQIRELAKVAGAPEKADAMIEMIRQTLLES